MRGIFSWMADGHGSLMLNFQVPEVSVLQDLRVRRFWGCLPYWELSCRAEQRLSQEYYLKIGVLFSVLCFLSHDLSYAFGGVGMMPGCCLTKVLWVPGGCSNDCSRGGLVEASAFESFRSAQTG